MRGWRIRSVSGNPHRLRGNRKVWGGNRTAAGAQAQGMLMSVFETCRRQTHSVVDHVSQTLRWFGNRLLPRPLLFRR